MNFELDPVGSLIAAVALIYPIITGRRQEIGKQLSYAANVLSTNSDAYEVYIRLTNSGTVPVTREDYETSLAFSFGDSAEIQEARMVEVSSSDLGVDVAVASSNRAEFTRVLLNPGDWFVLRVNLKRFQQVTPEGRVIGLGRVQEIKVPTHEGQGYREGQGFVEVIRSLVVQPRVFFRGLPLHGNFVNPFIFGVAFSAVALIHYVAFGPNWSFDGGTNTDHLYPHRYSR